MSQEKNVTGRERGGKRWVTYSNTGDIFDGADTQRQGQAAAVYRWAVG